MPDRVLVPFPLKGVTENTPYEGVLDGYAIDAMNVVGFDTIEERLRGGKRPGTGRAVKDPVKEDGTAVVRLGQITLTSDTFIDPGSFFTDTDYNLGFGNFGFAGGWGFPRSDLSAGEGAGPEGLDPELVYPDPPDPAGSPTLFTGESNDPIDDINFGGSKYAVVTSGIVVPGTCVDETTGSGLLTTSTGDPNGTFVLSSSTAVGADTEFFTLQAGWRHRRYTSSDVCGGTPDRDVTAGLRIKIQEQSGGGVITGTIEMRHNDPFSGADDSHRVFSASPSTDAIAAGGSLVYSNAYTPASGRGGHSGTLTIYRNPSS